jgi:hypothetical protein
MPRGGRQNSTTMQLKAFRPFVFRCSKTDVDVGDARTLVLITAGKHGAVAGALRMHEVFGRFNRLAATASSSRRTAAPTVR